MKYEIKGRYTKAVIYASILDEKTLSQIVKLTNLEWLEDSHISIMADAHAGKGCVIGTTIQIKDKVSPNLVGVDIGCGMLVVDVGTEDIDYEGLDNYIRDNIPSGYSNFGVDKYKHNDINNLRMINELPKLGSIHRSIGTLGGGNHFIEVGVSKDGRKHLVIHSGSRSLGRYVAEHYQDLAIKNVTKKLNKDLISSDERDFAYVEGVDFENYIHDMGIAQDVAKYSRECMANSIIDYLNSNRVVKVKKVSGIKGDNHFHTVHNYINMDDMVLRKGAISANKGEVVVIPINMKDGCIIAKGLGNKEANNSGPHGAGRLMSRSEAKELITLEEYEESMKEVYTTSVNENTIDESPHSYKPIEAILEDIQECVEVVEILKPAYSFKASVKK